MYVKQAKYGHDCRTQQGVIAGQVLVEILPQGNLTNHLQVIIEESRSLGTWPTPMLKLSIDNQPEIEISIDRLVNLLGVSTNSSEYVAPKIEPQKMVSGNCYYGRYRDWFIVFKFEDYRDGIIYTYISYENETEEGEAQFNKCLAFGGLDYLSYRLATPEEIEKYLKVKFSHG